MPETTAELPSPPGEAHLKAVREIENLLLQALARQGFRRRWGFTRISQSFVAAPGWFLWSSRRPGVHALEVTDARWETDRCGLGRFLWLRLGIKYYPHPEEPVFEDFSAAEKLLRLSPVFGDHGVPAPTAYGHVHPSFFGVGFIQCAIRSEGGLVWTSLQAPDCWIEIREAGLTIPGPTGEMIEGVPAGGLDRNVPGWTLAWPAFATLAAAFCLGSGSRIHSALAAERPAVTTLIKADGTVQEYPAADVLERCYEVWLLLSADAAAGRPLHPAGKVRADPDEADRPWRAVPLPPAPGRRTLPRILGAPT